MSENPELSEQDREEARVLLALDVQILAMVGEAHEAAAMAVLQKIHAYESERRLEEYSRAYEQARGFFLTELRAICASLHVPMPRGLEAEMKRFGHRVQ